MQHSTPSRFVQWSLIVGIGIVLNLFFNYTISLVYKAPQYTSTAPQVISTPVYTQESCVRIGGQWTQVVIDPKTTDPQMKQGGYCDPEYTNRIRYESEQKIYTLHIFLVLLILGIGTLIGGVVMSHEVLAPAFSWAGVLSIVVASMRYWSEADSLIKVLLLAGALGGLIWVALKKFAK